MADDDDEKKSRKRRVKKRSGMPSSVVCTANDALQKKGTVELGIVLSCAVLGLYVFGFIESMQALPDVPTGRLLGANLNIAKLQPDNVLLTTKGDEAIIPRVPIGMTVVDGVEIPDGKWPVSTRDEEDDFEVLLHPGDQKTTLRVPKFWSLPIHNKKLLTREQAMMIGTCVIPDPVTGSQVRGADCPFDERTIFVAIASYRDYQCRYTVESIFNRAKNPHRIRIGVVDQIVDGEDDVCNEPIEPCDQKPEQALCKYQDQIDLYKMEARLSIGPVFARHLGHRQYRGEYYATQSDAHVTYTQNWDADIIEQMEATHNEMAVLTTYLTDIQGSIDDQGHSLRSTRPIMCNTDYEGGSQGMHLRHLSQPERYPSIHGVPQLEPWWAAGYSFSRGHFVVNTPYDSYASAMIFQGEEMSIGIRGFTVGYDFYAPERSVCFHHYAVGKNANARSKVKHFWENGSLYAGTGRRAMQRLLGIVHMNPEVDPAQWDHTEEDRYGLGGVRTPEKFYELFGIDVVEKKTQKHLCMFVEKGKMHEMFSRRLRSDGMGIDYNGIDFKWKDPLPDVKDEDESEEE